MRDAVRGERRLGPWESVIRSCSFLSAPARSCNVDAHSDAFGSPPPPPPPRPLPAPSPRAMSPDSDFSTTPRLPTRVQAACRRSIRIPGQASSAPAAPPQGQALALHPQICQRAARETSPTVTLGSCPMSPNSYIASEVSPARLNSDGKAAANGCWLSRSHPDASFASASATTASRTHPRKSFKRSGSVGASVVYRRPESMGCECSSRIRHFMCLWMRTIPGFAPAEIVVCGSGRRSLPNKLA